MAGILSLIPGLGQLYNGETRKGMLFLGVTLINFVGLAVILFTTPILETMWNFGVSFHMKPNEVLVKVIAECHLGSPVSLFFLGWMICFVVFAARDAMDHASVLQKKRIYPEYVLELTEATSGSYIFHFSLMISCFILAFFFIIPPKPPPQITDIEFIQNQPVAKPKKQYKRKSEKGSEARGKHDKRKPVQAPSPAPKAPSKSQSPSKPSPAKQNTPKPVAKPVPTPRQATRPSPTPTPTPTPARATPSPTLRPTPSPTARPSPTPTPRPMAMAPSPSPSPRPSPSPMRSPSPSPAPMARPSAIPSANPSPSPSPVAIARAGAPSFRPAPRVGGPSGSFPGVPSPAPSPVAIGGGSGRSGTPTPSPVLGGGGGSTSRNKSEGGGGGGGAAAPAPSRAAGSRGGGPSGGGGPSIAVAPSVARPGGSPGGGGGQGVKGNPDAGARDGQPSVGSMADVDFGPYMADLQRRIKRAWFPPRGSESKRVVVTFKVHTQGQLTHLKIEKSSGVAIADQAALKAVENAAPFRPLPKGAPSVVDIEFTFDYNVFGGGGRGTFRRF